MGLPMDSNILDSIYICPLVVSTSLIINVLWSPLKHCFTGGRFFIFFDI